MSRLNQAAAALRATAVELRMYFAEDPDRLRDSRIQDGLAALLTTMAEHEERRDLICAPCYRIADTLADVVLGADRKDTP